MDIKSINTEYVTDSPYAHLIQPDGEFVPYYSTVIHYTDPRDGERADRVYNVSGRGNTEYESEQDAIANLKAQLSAKVYSAVEKYYAANGAGMLDIA